MDNETTPVISADQTGSPAASNNEPTDSDSPGVFFGTFQSPEKKFLPKVAHQIALDGGGLGSAFRRSPRLSPSPLRNFVESDQDVDGPSDSECDGAGSASRSGTPENDRFARDEPSSVLASRIIRAHDNPSPPPRLREFQDSPDTPIQNFSIKVARVLKSPSPYPHLFETTTARDKDEDLILKSRAVPFITVNDTPTPPSLILRDASPSPQPHSRPNTSQRDLISFESFCSPCVSAVQLPQAGPSSYPVPSPSRGLPITVDDLLSRSPSISPSPQHGIPSLSPNPPQAVVGYQLHPSQGFLPTADRSGSLSRSDIDVQQDPTRAESNDFEREKDLLASANLPSTTNIKEQEDNLGASSRAPTQLPSLPSLDPPMDEASMKPPLRRSPQRSPSPHPSCHTSVADATKETPPRRSLRRSVTPQLLTPLSSIQPEMNRWKGKGRAISHVDEVASDPEDGVSTTWCMEGAGRQEGDPVAGGEEVRGRELHNAMNDGNNPDYGKPHRGGKSDASRETFRRELRSLSPGSTSVLTQLLPSFKETPLHLNDGPSPTEAISTVTPPLPTFSFFPPQTTNSATQSPLPPSSPGRVFARARSRSRSRSPPKFTNSPNDTMLTPARRVPMTPGTVSARQLSQFSVNVAVASTGTPRTPIFSRPPPISLDDPIHSPRRVVIQEPKPQRPKSGSPLRLSRERSASVEPRPRGTRTRSGSADHLPALQPGKDETLIRSQCSSSSSPSRVNSKLPFPIVASNFVRPTTIHEVEPMDDSTATSKPTWNSSPTKSSLRQPSARSGSRIPRMGAKPYVRPPTAKATYVLPQIVRKVDDPSGNAGKPRQPLRDTGGSGSSSSSDDSNLKPGVAATSSRSIEVAESTSNAGLKRKRIMEKVSPPVPRPLVLIRQVPGSFQPKFLAKKALPAPFRLGVSPKKPSHGHLIIRRVFDMPPIVRQNDGEPEDSSLQNEVPKNGAEIIERSILRTPEAIPSTEDAHKPMTRPSPPVNVQSTPSSSPRVDPFVPYLPGDKTAVDETIFPSFPNEAGPSSKVRRTSRLRKPTQTITSDVFGTTDGRPSQHRRKGSTSRPEAFSGMSAVALKALTSSNTMKNQQYLVAKLETEVIRKEGARPESPSVKVRTILQREQEEKGKQRQARAERRARRSDDGTSDVEGDSSVLGEDDIGYDTHTATQPPLKHRRGPGDEEDYETPFKVERAVKRMRYESDEGAREKKRVKWDRGLSTAIYLDELQPGTRRRLQEAASKKGCLAVTAKALRLDALGNIINADTPLSDLVHENIVVKKFVYDNDNEPEVYIPRATRSRGKKSKS